MARETDVTVVDSSLRDPDTDRIISLVSLRINWLPDVAIAAGRARVRVMMSAARARKLLADLAAVVAGLDGDD